MVDIGECCAIVQEAVILGEAIAECRFAPLSDRMSRRQAVQYLVSRGYRTPEATLKSWQQLGILHIRKPPGSANRKLIISFRELQQCVLAQKIQKSL
jgi:hypothetical protein